MPDPDNPLTYVTSDGTTITPQIFQFDGATTPRYMWWSKYLSPWEWPRAAAMHDWLFEAHHRGKDECGFLRANQILAEACRTLGVPEPKIDQIRWAVNKFGRRLWDDAASYDAGTVLEK